MKSILKKNVKIFLIVAMTLILANILNAMHPFVLKRILDLDFNNTNITIILRNLVIIYILIHIFLIIAKDLKNTAINKAMTKILKDLREKLFCHVLKWNMTTYQKYNSSEIYTRLTADIENVSSLFLGTLQVLVNDILYIAIMVAFMFLADIKLAIIGSMAMILTALVSYIFTHQVAKCSKQILNRRDKENMQYSEMYNKNKLTYLFHLQKSTAQKINDTLDEEFVFRKKFIFLESFSYPLSTIIQALAIYIILQYALNIDGVFSLGSIYLVINYIKECRTPLNEIFDQLEEIQSSFMSLQRINVLLKEDGVEDIKKGESKKSLKGDIEFQNVYMQYGEHNVLKDISFVIKQGTVVTIAGKTGVGKTTLANILMRLYPIKSGKILIDNEDISNIKIRDIRENISYISQTPYILDDTLKNNITLGSNNVTDEKIELLAKDIGFEKVLNSFKNGLNENISKEKLSLGQLQMIAFLRAVLHKADIYIFDEPTSSIDLRTEDMMQKIINKISKDSTVIIIAHRKSTISNSNKIIYLKDGKVYMIVNKT